MFYPDSSFSEGQGRWGCFSGRDCLLVLAEDGPKLEVLGKENLINTLFVLIDQ